MGFWEKWQRARLYKQWVEKSGLSADDIPADLRKDKRDSQEYENSTYEESPGRVPRSRASRQIDGLFTSTRIRFTLIMAIIIVILLVAVSVLLTILIMQGC